MFIPNDRFTKKGFLNNEEYISAKKKKRTVIRKLTVSFVLFLVLFVSTYLLLANDFGKFFTINQKRIFITALTSLFIINFILLSLHLTIDFKLKHYLKLYDLYDIVQFLVTIVIIILFIQMFVLRVAKIVGPSMEPTLLDDDRVLVYQLKRNFKHDDIIVLDAEVYSSINLVTDSLEPYVDSNQEFYIKRIRAIPGDKLELVQIDSTLNYELKVNGVALKDISDKSIKISESNIHFENIKKLINLTNGTVPEGHYFLLGDNVNNSKDSRTFGFVSEKDIFGVVRFRLWRKIGAVK